MAWENNFDQYFLQLQTYDSYFWIAVSLEICLLIFEQTCSEMERGQQININKNRALTANLHDHLMGNSGMDIFQPVLLRLSHNPFL